MMATSTMAAVNNHFQSSSTTASTATVSAQDSGELTARLTQMQLKDRHQMTGEAKIPRRQPTIVCEDIADDIDFDDDAFGDEELIEGHNPQPRPCVVRSASTASLTVPQTGESEDERRRPPLPTEEQMLIESN